MCYVAIVPLLVYGLLLAFNVVDRTDGNVSALLLAECVAIFVTLRALARRYRQ